MHIAVVTVSDLAFKGVFDDLNGPMIREWLSRTLLTECSVSLEVVPADYAFLRDRLIDLCDQQRVDLVLTVGAVGPGPGDITPEVMRAVVARDLPGFGEAMRRMSLDASPLMMLSRQSAGVRGRSLIVNLSENPALIHVCLGTVFQAIPYCLDLIGAGRIETDPARVRAYRPGR